MSSNSPHPSTWKYPSPEKPGFHTIISPENSPCRVTWVFHLNKQKNDRYTLFDDVLELNALLIKGKVLITYNDKTEELEKTDSFYLPAGEKIMMEFLEDSILLIGGAKYEGKGHFYYRRYNPQLPLGDIRQVHGETPYRRDVFMTLSEKDEASRLICGITTGDPGAWTSWPPHQHSKDLEEVYCYFDLPENALAFHFSSRKTGEFEHIHPVRNGDCVVVPEGYHPTLGMPGISSNYFWIMAAFTPEQRRYDLAVNDPVLSKVGKK